MYERMKTDRNRYLSTIQTSRQLIVELSEKSTILGNGIAVLRKEFDAVERLFSRKSGHFQEHLNEEKHEKVI
jgi:hypothetical protein